MKNALATLICQSNACSDTTSLELDIGNSFHPVIDLRASDQPRALIQNPFGIGAWWLQTTATAQALLPSALGLRMVGGLGGDWGRMWLIFSVGTQPRVLVAKEM